MIRLATGIYSANPSPAMTASYSAVLFEHPFVREKEYGISALSGETNRMTPTTLSCTYSLHAPSGSWKCRRKTSRILSGELSA